MEFRKLISFGKSSFVISLPKNWIRQNKLNKGDLVYLEERGSNIILSKKQPENQNKDKSITILVDGKTIPAIQREVTGAYISNNNIIILKGATLKNIISEIQEIFQKMIALEIMEQTTDTIIAKDFLNTENVQVEELTHKMDIITRTMLNECADSLNEKNYKTLKQRDEDVNRLYFLLYRTVLYNMEHPLNAMKKYKMEIIDLFYHWMAGFQIEGVADEAKKVAKYANLINKSQKEKDAITKFLRGICDYYLESIKAFNNKDREHAFSISEKKTEFYEKLREFEKNNEEVNFAKMISHIRGLINYIHRISRTTYQKMYY